jgi:hypothetical protein
VKNSLYILIVSLVLITRISNSQALYKNANDFLEGKTAHGGKNTRIKLHQLFKKNILEIKHNDTVYAYFKKDIYGYVDKEGNSSRFINNEIYPILNPSESILIYKQTSGFGTKSSPTVTIYFFSRNADSEILPLTLENLETTFKDNAGFSRLIEIYFKTDNELIEYDPIHKMYKINRLLELAKAL